ncbi:MAG: PqqD family protein [Patescibacteria group bacterium]
MVQNKIKKYKRKPKIASHVIDNTIYLLDEKNDELVILNESSYILWKKLAKESTIEDLCQELQNTYSVSKDKVKKDIEEFIKKIFKREFVISV